ncbi:restriction endonuclease subunit S [Chromobacterium amazonense]|uniref:restriction endonuclease subunit S n=1 Tax=Chromobacterium amazonense TaxID=1382803 RepID=UPI00237E3A9E|nr:restriction endonuclease subunit S [Chromobacterium amazonense]MDE1715626.1 restriction endonuclease subunit S [Chromobacterium amazonense]
MSAEIAWSTLSLKAAGVTLIDCDHRTPPAVEAGYPYIAIPQLKDGHITLDGVRRISESDYADWTKKLAPQTNDVIVVRRCNSGQSAHVPAGLKCAIGQNLVVLRADGTKVLPQYLRWLVRGSEWWNEVGKYINVGAVFDSLRCRDIPNFELPIPPLEEQREISETLAVLDDRITLLRETNATLEAIAQALFKSWFVDFDPVRAKMEGRAPEGMDEATAALFPDGLEESELGLVPRGWRVGALGEFCTVTIGGLWGKDTKEDDDLVPAISLRGVDLEHLRVLGFAEDAPTRWVKRAAMAKRLVNQNEVLIASSGAGPCGRTLWAGANFELLYGKPVIFSNFVKRLDCGNAAIAIYVDRLLAEMRESKEIWNFINGTSIPNLDDKLLLATKKVVLPSDEALSAFENIARTIYSKLYSKQAQTLAILRDTLLPRLISGQLRLPEAEALIA